MRLSVCLSRARAVSRERSVFQIFLRIHACMHIRVGKYVTYVYASMSLRVHACKHAIARYVHRRDANMTAPLQRHRTKKHINTSIIDTQWHR